MPSLVLVLTFTHVFPHPLSTFLPPFLLPPPTPFPLSSCTFLAHFSACIFLGRAPFSACNRCVSSNQRSRISRRSTARRRAARSTRGRRGGRSSGEALICPSRIRLCRGASRTLNRREQRERECMCVVCGGGGTGERTETVVYGSVYVCCVVKDPISNVKMSPFSSLLSVHPPHHPLQVPP